MLVWRSSQFLFSLLRSSFLLHSYWYSNTFLQNITQFSHVKWDDFFPVCLLLWSLCFRKSLLLMLFCRCVSYTCITSTSLFCSWPTWRLWWTHTTAPSLGNTHTSTFSTEVRGHRITSDLLSNQGPHILILSVHSKPSDDWTNFQSSRISG